MKIKLHNRYYNWAHIKEIFPTSKYCGESIYYPQVIIWFFNKDQPVFFTFDSAKNKKQTSEEAEKLAEEILDSAMAYI